MRRLLLIVPAVVAALLYVQGIVLAECRAPSVSIERVTIDTKTLFIQDDVVAFVADRPRVPVQVLGSVSPSPQASGCPTYRFSLSIDRPDTGRHLGMPLEYDSASQRFYLSSGFQYAFEPGEWVVSVRGEFLGQENVQRVSEARFSFKADFEQPTVDVVSPGDGAVVKGGPEGFDVLVHANDDAELKHLAIKVDGVERQRLLVQGSASANRTFHVVEPLSTNRRVTALAIDRANRSDEESISVHTDAEAPIIWDIRVTGQHIRPEYYVVGSPIDMSARVQEPGGAGVDQVFLKESPTGRSRARATRPSSGDRYSFNAIGVPETSAPPPAGYKVYLEAIDKVGNIGRSSVITLRRSSTPQFPRPDTEDRLKTIRPRVPVQPPALD